MWDESRRGSELRDDPRHRVRRAAAATAEGAASPTSQLPWVATRVRVWYGAERAECGEPRDGWKRPNRFSSKMASAAPDGHVGPLLPLDVGQASGRVVRWIPFGRDPANTHLQTAAQSQGRDLTKDVPKLEGRRAALAHC